MTKLGYFDAKRNKPRSPNYKKKKLNIYKKHRFSSLVRIKLKKFKLK